MTIRTAVHGTFLQCTGLLLPETCVISDVKTLARAGMFIGGSYYEQKHVMTNVWCDGNFYLVCFDAVYNGDSIVRFVPRYVDDGPDIYDFVDPGVVA